MCALLFNVRTRASRAHGLTICGLRTYQNHNSRKLALVVTSRLIHASIFMMVTWLAGLQAAAVGAHPALSPQEWLHTSIRLEHNSIETDHAGTNDSPTVGTNEPLSSNIATNT